MKRGVPRKRKPNKETSSIHQANGTRAGRRPRTHTHQAVRDGGGSARKDAHTGPLHPSHDQTRWAKPAAHVAAAGGGRRGASISLLLSLLLLDAAVSVFALAPSLSPSLPLLLSLPPSSRPGRGAPVVPAPAPPSGRPSPTPSGVDASRSSSSALPPVPWASSLDPVPALLASLSSLLPAMLLLLLPSESVVLPLSLPSSSSLSDPPLLLLLVCPSLSTTSLPSYSYTS